MIHPLNDDNAQRLLWKIANMLYVGLGLAGSVRVADTSTHTGRFFVYHALTDTVVASITYAGFAPGAIAAGDVIKAGDRIYGVITSFSAASGSGELYAASML